MTSISPKVWVPLLTSVVAGLLLWAITGDREWLIVTLTGIVSSGIGYGAPVVKGVKMSQVQELIKPK